MKRITLTCCSILFLAPFTCAQLAIAKDSPESNKGLSSHRAIYADLSIPPDEAWILPVKSSQLSPGKVISRQLKMPGLKPFFLVGDDPRSLDWLRQRAGELKAIEAAGLAVEVADTNALSRIRAAAPGITILPVNGNDIAARLQLDHYPVLITATSLEQ
ncbi:integrating conjugative element protein [Pseudomonas fluorescens]|uniref:integrating conjugative element protein n=1 Tax=Pseudomonas fluorescens TaxID=294 RepID=UPI0010E39B3D|nr:integrating conjugative element protein [Pseudomonas fluorescens]TCV62198.1 integrating conjugative element protein (TIGR03765 family) [Pseudomonas fluorescens]